MSDDIVSTGWLARHLDSPDIAILDASWHLPSARRDAPKEFAEGHIPGAQFFDIDELSDTANPLPHMLPSPEKFSSRMRKMGVGDGKRVIVYDTQGLYSAARAWWMFKVFGHDDVTVLDGGLPKWKAEGRPLADGAAAKPQERHFTARYRSMLVRDKTEVAAALKSAREQLADARGPARFRGEEPEPRAGVRAGHMPGARNVHYASLLKPDGTLKSAEDVAAIFKAAGIDLARPVITSCGSGVTAAIVNLGLTLAGARAHALYDGSWAEWGADADLSVVTGPA
ncbi:MAG: 3-mercaptopyruvate sulfurtransferase [Rhizobiales bacterium]|nr:3-mercaptopyruvate sulfurtransferase [Hyphomicrobiales bacterium]MBI3674904.1 3-mercaptopyruvate sulfurtransferase [Hyphomicrobiales bacterium]